MKALVLYEIKKTAKQKQITGLLGIFFLVLLFFFTEDRIYGYGPDGFSYTSYRQMVSDVQKGELSRKEIEKQLESAEGIEPGYTSACSEEEALYQCVYRELYQIDHYKEWLGRMLDSDMTFVQSSNSYYVRKQEKIKKVYSGLTNISVSFDGNYGVSLLKNPGVYDLLIPVSLLLLALGLIAEERENDMGLLLHAAAGGQRKLGLAKYITGLLGAGCIAAFVSVGKVMLIGVTYQISRLQASIQSVPQFQECPYPITIFQFILFYFVLNILVCSALFSLFYFIILRIMNRIAALFFSLGGFGLFYLLHQRIGKGSFWEPLRLYNPWSFLDTGSVIGDWQLENLFGVPISYFIIYLAVNIVIVIGVSWYSVFCFARRDILKTERKSGRHDILMWRWDCYGGSFIGEIRKCFSCRSIVWILALLTALVLFSPAYYDSLDSYDKVYYKNYIKKVEGPCSDEKKRMLQQEERKINRSKRVMQQDNLTSEAYDILARYTARENALKQVQAQQNYLEQQADGYFLYEKGYLIYTDAGEGSWINLLFHGAALLLTVLFSTMVWSVEKETGMEQLIHISAMGSKGVWKRKKWLIFLLSFVISICVYGYMFFAVNKEYDLRYFHATAESIRRFSRMPSCIRIWMIFAITGLLRWMYLFIAGLLASFVVRKQKTYQTAAVISFLICFMPVVLFFCTIL